MRNKRKSLIMKILFCIISLGVILTSTQVLANSQTDIRNLIKGEEYTEEYKAWLELPEDERKNTIEPRKYDVQYERQYSTYLKRINNKIRVVELLKTTATDKYDLREHIPMSVKIKNQEATNMCWAFAGTATLETHLALKDYKNNIKDIEYDFSERHMAYSAAQKSLSNSESYLYGFNNKVADGGNYFMVQQYLTTGNGAVLDEDMPFVNTQQSIDIKEIDKEVATTLLDTTLFATDDQTTREELMAEMKSYITNYGGIYAGIHGASTFSNYFNNSTGAIYCDDTEDAPMNHAVLIIGWKDDFSKDYFGNALSETKCVPESNGAWIIKNSWGEYTSESLSEIKQALYIADTEELNELGYLSAEELPNDYILIELETIYGEGKVTIDEEQDTVTFEIGDKGYMYVSYEDANIYSNLWGIENAKTEVDYDNLYQHDALGYSAIMSIRTGAENPVYIANVFSRDAQKQEELTKISIFTTQEYTAKVYVNPNGDSLTSNLQEITLAEGNEQNTVNIKPGYHTIEFAEPVKLTGQNFAVIMEISNSFERKKVAVEYADPGSSFENAVIYEGESFVSLDMAEWLDTTSLPVPCNGNITIKAFTDKGNTGIEAEPEPTPDEKQPILSKLEEINVALTEMDMPTDDENDNYVITLKVDGINISEDDTLHKYYWYISGTQGDSDIKDEYWTEVTSDKIIKQNDGTYSIEVKINSINLPNKAELMNSDNLYLYIKEIATINNNNKSQIVSKAIKIDAKVEEDTSEKIEEVITPEDDTIASGIIPNAGINIKIIVIIVAVAIVSIIAYNRFRYFNI